MTIDFTSIKEALEQGRSLTEEEISWLNKHQISDKMATARPTTLSISPLVNLLAGSAWLPKELKRFRSAGYEFTLIHETEDVSLTFRYQDTLGELTARGKILEEISTYELNNLFELHEAPSSILANELMLTELADALAIICAYLDDDEIEDNTYLVLA